MVNADSAYIGGQNPMSEGFLSNRQREASGLPPVGAVEVTASVKGEDVPVPVPVSVAREALYRHMSLLREKASVEITDPYRFMGNGPYLDQMRAQWQATADMTMAEKERAREELARLGKLTDTEIVQWAVSNGHIGRTYMGHWAVK